MRTHQLHCLLIAIALLSCTVDPASAQRKYFEYNNPEAKRITDKMIAKLVAHDWKVREIKVKVRQDTFTYHGGSLKYNIDGTYQGRYQDGGTWKVEYNRYINHVSKATDPGVRVFSGIYSILELTDTVLVMQELQTSSRDMSRTIYFSKNPFPAKWQSISTTREYPHRIGPLTPSILDNISRLTDETLFINNFNYSPDSVIIETQDSVYRIKRNN